MPCKLIVFLFLIFLFPCYLFSDSRVDFNTFFFDKTLRIDYYHIADGQEEIFTLDKIYQEGIWAGNHNELIELFNIGHYYINVYDIATNKHIYSKGFDSLCGEYRTTKPAGEGIKKTFHETILIPYPRRSILVVIEARNKDNLLLPVFSIKIDPQDYHILKEKTSKGIQIFELIKCGEPSKKVDVAFLSEGYTPSELEKYKSDLEKIIKVFFSIEPYKSNQGKFNIYGIFIPSQESGSDEPRKGVYRNTALNSSFNAFDSERYLLSEDNKKIRDIAGTVPYDAIIIMANSKRYGGGGIYNTYAIFTIDHPLHEYLFHHEFGHSFTGLADEYYTSDVAYEDFFPQGVEPMAPNITALLDVTNIKWKKHLSPGIDIPTDWRKEVFDSLTAMRSQNQEEMQKIISEMEDKGVRQDSIDLLRVKYHNRDLEITNRIKDFFINHPLREKIGAFEGAGYKNSGLFRPTLNSIMHRFMEEDKFFYRVSEQAIVNVINYYVCF